MRNPLVELICDVCNDQFYRKKYLNTKNQKRSISTVCSPKCLGKLTQQKGQGRADFPCNYCGKLVNKRICETSENKYCDSVCFSESLKKTKVCRGCKETLKVNKFPKNPAFKDGLNSRCKKCKQLQRKAAKIKNAVAIREGNRLRAKDRKAKNIKLAYNYLLSHSCVHCGESNPIVLEFDHLRDKKYNVSHLIATKPWSRTLEEIEKCQVLCANCHRIKTAKDFNYTMYQLQQESLNT